MKVGKWCKSNAEPYCPITAISNIPNWRKTRDELEDKALVRKHGGRKDTVEITDLGWDVLEEVRPSLIRRRRGQTFELK